MYGVVNDWIKQSQKTRAVKLYGALLRNIATNGKNTPISYSWGGGIKNRSYNLLSSGHYKDVKARIHATNGGNYQRIFTFAGDLKNFNKKSIYTFTPHDIKEMPNLTQNPPLHPLTYGNALKRVRKAYPSLKRVFESEEGKGSKTKVKYLSKMNHNLNKVEKFTTRPREIRNLEKAKKTIYNIANRMNSGITPTKRYHKVQIHDFTKQKTYGETHKVKPKYFGFGNQDNTLRRNIEPDRK